MALTHTEVIVLGLLSEEPMYGYQLLERYRVRAMGLWAEAGRASIYQALHRLDRDGLVSGRAQKGQEGPSRRVYRITRSGRDALRQALLGRFPAGGPHPADAALPFGFAHIVSADEVRRGIAARETGLRDRVEAVKHERARLQSARGPANTLARKLLDREESVARAELAWLGAFRSDVGRIRR